MNLEERKQQFLKWLLVNYRHPNPSVNYLLEFLANNHEVSRYIHFTDGAKYAPRGIYISFHPQSAIPFVYYKDQLSYTLSDQAFHDIRLNFRLNQVDYYVELAIPHLYQELYRFDVYETNPYIPQDQAELEALDDFLIQMSRQVKLDTLTKEMNVALDRQQFETVEYLMKQIERLKGE